MITLSQVTVKREGRLILSDVSLTLNPGQHVVVRGEAGSGKTTLLELLSGRLHPTHGQVRQTTAINSTRPHVLYVPVTALQASCAHPDLFYQQRYYSLGDEEVPTVAEYLGAEMSAASGIAVMESIKPLLSLKITRLSNGQSRKVLLCRHLMHPLPQVLLLDYPLEGLDAVSRRDWIRFLEQLASEHQVQVVLTDHGHELPSMIQTEWFVGDGTVRAEAMSKQTVSMSDDIVPAYAPSTHGGEPLVEFRGLNLRYGDRDIIRDFHWRVNRGDRWVLCGPNGSGKTTMFSFIFADHPWAYREPVYIFGRRRGTGESIWDIKKRIAYLGPEPAAFQHHQALPQSAAAYLRQHYPTSSDMIQSLVQHWQLENFIHQPIRTLSSGTRQLLWLAEALLADRELLLLDEPFRFLDPLARQRVTHYLQHHHGKDKTLIIITHDEEDLLRWGQQVMRLVPAQ